MLKHIWSIFNRSPKETLEISRGTKDLFEFIECQANDPCEDRISYGTIDEIGAHYLAVFDGHGGSKVSEYLKKNIHTTITKVIQNTGKVISDIDSLIKLSFQQIFEIVEQDVLQIMNKEAVDGQFEECGSCALLAVVTKTRVYVANAGDSQGVILNSDEEKARITNKQLNTKLSSEIERLRKKFPTDETLFVKKNDAYYIKGKIMPTYTIGDFSLKYKRPNKKLLEHLSSPYLQYKPDTRSFQINSEDKYLLLASDGLWDILTPSEVSKIVLSTPKDLCLKKLINECYERCALSLNKTKQQIMSCKTKRRFIDDISIILFDLSENN